jgi:hypothetical protein
MRYFIQKNSSIRFRKKKYNLNKNISNLVYFLKRNYILVKLRFFGFPFGLQTRKRLKKVILEKCINKKNRLYKIKKIQVKESNIKFKTTYNNFNTLFFFKNYIKKYISIKFKHFFNFKRMSLYWSKKKKLKILGKNFRKINNFISGYSGLNLNGEGDISNLNIIKLPLYLPYAYSRLESTWFNTSISLNFKPEKQLLLNYIKFVLNAKYFSNYNHSWFVRMGTNYLYDFGETIIKKYFSVNPLLLWDTFYKENIGMNTLLFNFIS